MIVYRRTTPQCLAECSLPSAGGTWYGFAATGSLRVAWKILRAGSRCQRVCRRSSPNQAKALALAPGGSSDTGSAVRGRAQMAGPGATHILPSSCRAAHQADGGESGAVRSPACFWTAGVWPRYSSRRAEHGPVRHQRHPASVPGPRSHNHRAYSRIATMNSKKGFYPCYPQDGPRPAAVSASRCTAARHRLNAHTWYSTKSNNWCER